MMFRIRRAVCFGRKYGVGGLLVGWVCLEHATAGPRHDFESLATVVQAYSHLVGLGKLLARLNLPYRLYAIYQLRVVLCGVSPLVWRRLLMVRPTRMPEFREMLQNAFGGE